MKKILFFALSLALFAACSKPASNLTYVSDTFTVNGSCGMCKTNIEKAAKIPGVSTAVWNQKANSLTVKYAPSKVDIMAVHKSIAAAGYDTDKAHGDDAAYGKLPGCCKYRDK